VLIVVVRYFGGTLLGVGGLIGAYKAAAQAALAATSIKERFILFEYAAEFGFDDMNRVMRILKENEASVVSTSYQEINRITFRVKKMNSERMEHSFKNLYTCQLTFLKTI
jgi:putative IMPACT (imprinted ancient) family translation regulator